MASTPTSELAIAARGLGKRYRLSGTGNGREPRVERAGRRLPIPFRGRSEWLWALRHVDLEVRRGEIHGVIGRNGSGKTTLLKILASVTAPSAGRAELRGRVVSLLQVGVGFHPQLTGRDNIMLSGAIMGLKPDEISARFDQIVEFSEVGRFIDEPVKRYSSGMHARLAFSTSAFLPADVMLLDEVLAVGDAAFGQKATELMTSLLKDGRSVVYVGHGMDAIRKLCDRVLVLDKGRPVFTGPADEATDFYEHAYVRGRARHEGQRHG